MSQLYTLTNKHLSIQISSLGAELRSIFDHEAQLECIWQRDPTYWAKSSPVLFPAVGNFLNNRYDFQGRNYALSKHGFARDQEFLLLHQTTDCLLLELRDDEELFKRYPFSFSLRIHYLLQDDQLEVHYQICNRGTYPLYFGFGTHPAFAISKNNLPFALSDYKLIFELDEKLHYQLLQDDLLASEIHLLDLDAGGLRLSKALFLQDALIFSNLKSRSIRVESTAHSFTFAWKGFDYFGLWSSKGADFFCLEPWASLPDTKFAEMELQAKSTIISLTPQSSFESSWSFKLNKAKA